MAHILLNSGIRIRELEEFCESNLGYTPGETDWSETPADNNGLQLSRTRLNRDCVNHAIRERPNGYMCEAIAYVLTLQDFRDERMRRDE